MPEIDLFETMNTMRAMRRLKPDPVPLELIRKVLEAGTKAPSGQNTQPWAFLVVQDPEGKKFIQERYHRAVASRFGTMQPAPGDPSSQARMGRAAQYLSEHMHEVPVLLLCSGLRDWPAAVPPDQRVGKAPPSYGPVYPCVQNILLACRGLGLGATLTTAQMFFEEELHATLVSLRTMGRLRSFPLVSLKGSSDPLRAGQQKS